MKLRKPLIPLGALAAALVPVVAFAAFSALRSNAGTTVKGGTVQGPATAAGTHNLSVSTTPNSDTVTLTWKLDTTKSLVPDTFKVERAGATSGTLSWSTLAGAGALPESTACSGSPLSCSYTDGTAAMNSQYDYRVTSQMTGTTWTAGPARTLHYSMKSTAAFEVGGIGSGSLNAVASEGTGGGTGGPLLAVGSDGRIYVCLATASCSTNPSTGWQIQAAEAVPLNGVAFVDSTHAWAVGGNSGSSSVFACTAACDTAGATWAGQTVPVGGTLRSVFFTSASDGWAVGDGGTIDYTSSGGSTWTRVSGITTPNFLGVAAITAKDVLVVGSGGGARHCSVSGGNSCNGSGTATWTSESTGVSANLNSVAFTTGKVYNAVGDSGAVLADNNGTWQSTAVGTGSWSAIATFGGTTEWMAGAGGAIATCAYSGSNKCATVASDWTAKASGTAATLKGAAMASATAVWAVGAERAIVHSSDGTNFGYQQSSLGGAEITNLQAGAEGGTFTTGVLPSALPTSTTACAGGATSEPAVLFQLPVSQAMSAVSSAKVTLRYSMTGTSTAARLLYTTDSSTAWTAIALTPPGTTLTADTETMTISAPASQLKVCLEAAGTGSTATLDLVHADLDGS